MTGPSAGGDPDSTHMPSICHINMSREFRGGERQTLALILALADDVAQCVVTRRHSPLHEALAARIPSSVRIAAVANSPLSAWRATGGADIVHVHEGRSVAVGAARTLVGTPFILTRRVLKPPSHHGLTRWCYARSSAVVCVSDAVANVMREYDAHLPVHTILDCAPEWTPVDPAAARALRSRFGATLLIGQVGELDDAAKGQRLTLAVARRIAPTHPQALFLLIGGGKDEDLLRAEAADLPNVRFIGRVDNVAQYYAALDVLVFPSRSEALGSSILEGMSFGLPVVAASVGGIPEIVHDGETGLLFPCDEAKAFHAHLSRLLDSAELRQRMSRAAGQAAQAFRPAVMARSYLGLYAQVLAGHSR